MGLLHIINLFVLLFLGIMYIFMPKIMNKYLLFGVTVTDEILETDEVKESLKQYTLSMIFTTTFVTILYIVLAVWYVNTVVWGFIGLLMMELIVMSVFYVIAHKKVKAVKGAPVETTKIISASIGADTEFKVLPWYAFLVYLVIIIGLAVYGFVIYDSLPDVLAIHFDANGVADGFADKSYGYVLLMPILMFMMMLLFMGVNYSFKIAKKVSGAGRRKISFEQERISRFYWSIGIYVLGFTMMLLFAVTQLFTFGIFTQSEIIVWITGLTLVMVMTIVGVLVLTTGQSGSRVKVETEESDIEDADDDEFWKLGAFYVNKNDPSLFVNKRFGVGMTLNFANKWSWVFIALIVLIVVASFALPAIL